MTKTVQDYQNLVTSQYQQQPNFMAVVALSVAVQVHIQSLLSSMIDIFDIDQAPVGDQLNTIGLLAGLPRQAALISLTDSDYLTLVRMKIALNQWDGTTEGIYTIFATLFPSIAILIQDNSDMSMSYLVSSSLANIALVRIMIDEGFFVKPEGVQLSSVIYASDVRHFFGMTDYQYYEATGQIQPNATPLNLYESYNTAWPWLDYSDAIGTYFVARLTTEDGSILETESGQEIDLE